MTYSGGESANRYTDDPSVRIMHKEITVPATLDQVWEAWTTTEGVKTFFSSAATVELKLGGVYEIYFLLDQPYGLRGSEDCRILSFLPKKMLSFEWNAPPDFGELRQRHTQVIMHFEEVKPGQVKASFAQLGWGKGENWDKLYEYFDRAWDHVLKNLKTRFESGPLDWSKK